MKSYSLGMMRVGASGAMLQGVSRLLLRLLRWLIPLPWFFVLGCNQRPPLHFQIGDGFTTDEVSVLHAAAHEWDAVALEPITFDGDGDEWTIVLDADVPTDEAGATYWHHTWQVAIKPDLPANVFACVALHELGHSHGLAHLPTGQIGVMGGTSCNIMSDDIAECRRVGACQ